MTKLLSAGFRRLFRSVVFWLGLAVSCGYTLLGVLNNFYYKGVFEDTVILADHTLFPFAAFVALIAAVVVALFIGQEYADKTIRNKIITGHSRLAIYLSNLMICSVAAIILFVVPTLLIGLAIGGPLMGGFELPAGAFILPALCYLLALLGFTSLFVLLAMSIDNRTVAAVTILLVVLALSWIPTPLRETLEAPEYVEQFVFSETLDDFVETGEMMENEMYVGGPARVALQVAYDLLPGCQVNQTSPFNKTADMVHLPVWSFIFIAATTAAGVVIFQKKELK